MTASMHLSLSSDTCDIFEERGASGRHRRSRWPAGQCGRRGDGRGDKFLRYGSGFGRLLDGDIGSCAFQGRRSFLAMEGASEKFFSPVINLCID